MWSLFLRAFVVAVIGETSYLSFHHNRSSLQRAWLQRAWLQQTWLPASLVATGPTTVLLPTMLQAAPYPVSMCVLASVSSRHMTFDIHFVGTAHKLLVSATALISHAFYGCWPEDQHGR